MLDNASAYLPLHLLLVHEFALEQGTGLLCIPPPLRTFHQRQWEIETKTDSEFSFLPSSTATERLLLEFWFSLFLFRSCLRGKEQVAAQRGQKEQLLLQPTALMNKVLRPAHTA